MPHSTVHYLPHPPPTLDGLEDPLAVLGATIGQQHADSGGSIVRVNHLEAIGTRLRQGVHGVLYGHGGCTLEELADQPVAPIGRENVHVSRSETCTGLLNV